MNEPGPLEITCESWLAPSEVERANRFRRLNNRNQHILGRGMARWLLGDREVPPESILFDEESGGKPFVVQPAAAKQPFNIAHTDGLVVCGIADPAIEMVGVDVENESRKTSTDLAERYFSKPEIQYVRSKPIARQKEAFLRVWTLKESFIKAIGTGLRTPLADFAFREIDSGRPTIELLNSELNDPFHWQFFSFRPRQGFIGAVAFACRDHPHPIDVEFQTFDDVIDIKPAEQHPRPTND